MSDEEKTELDRVLVGLESNPPGVLQPAPGSAPLPIPRRSYSPAPWEKPEVVEELEREAESRGERIVVPPPAKPARPRQDTPAWIEPPWWRTTGGMVKVLGAFFTGCTALGVGGWFASRPEEAPKAAPAADVVCPKFEDTDAPRGALCMRIYQLEGALGTVQGELARRRAREERERKMLGQEPPEVKPPK